MKNIPAFLRENVSERKSIGLIIESTPFCAFTFSVLLWTWIIITANNMYFISIRGEQIVEDYSIFLGRQLFKSGSPGKLLVAHLRVRQIYFFQ